MLLSIIIVNYNVKYFLEQCLLSVQKACLPIDAEILVVDNNSTDGSREWLEKMFPQVKFIWQTVNEGFGKANNRALKLAGGKFVLFLNPDTVIAEDTLEQCIRIMVQDESVGALGIRMIDGSGRFLRESKRGFPTASAAFYKMVGLAKLFPRSRKFAKYYAGHLNENDSNETDVLAGAFMMLSRKAVEITKGFDEEFFMYGEDVDLSYRIQKAGLKNIYYAGSTVIHFKGESTQRYSASYNNHFYGAMNLFVKKHFSDQRMLMFMTNIAIAAGKLSAAGRGLFQTKESRSNTSKPLHTAVAASQQTFDRTIQLLKYAVPPVSIAGRISLNKSDTGTSLAFIGDSEKLSGDYKIEQVVFCEGELTFKELISLAESFPRRIQKLFHARGSASIVGSSDKNRKGKFIAKPGVN